MALKDKFICEHGQEDLFLVSALGGTRSALLKIAELGKKANDIFDHSLGYMAFLAAILLIFITLSVTAGVVMRYLLERPIIWVVEISQYSLLFIAFLGAAWVLKRERHVKMDLLIEHLGPRNKNILNIITSTLAAITCLVVTWYSLLSTVTYFQLDYFTPTILEVRQWILLAIIPVGSFLLFIQFIRRTYNYWRAWKLSPKSG